VRITEQIERIEILEAEIAQLKFRTGGTAAA
jgi:hypothetical protein